MPNRFLTEIKLENFQDHKDSTISLTNGINLIVGSSDAGKSAILRAVEGKTIAKSVLVAKYQRP